MIDINSYDNAQLHLNAVKLPEIQRRKTEEDERQMRQFLCEGDLVVAEVQQISNQDKSISIHIRNNNFGKLQNGFLTKVSSDLVKK
jgi:exosome complex component RRP4